MGLDIVEMMIAIEREFSIEVPNEEWQDSVTVGLAYETVCRHIGERPEDPPNGTATWERLLNVISEQTAVRRDRLLYDTNFVEDLRLD